MVKDSKKTKIKLMYVVESFATGVYSVVKDIACNLPDDTFDIMIVHSLRDDSPKNYQNDFDKPNIELIYLKMDSLKSSLKAVCELKHKIIDWKPDIVHLHSSKAGFIGRLATRAAGLRNVFYSPHGFAFLRQDVNPLNRYVFFMLEKAAAVIGGGTIIAVSDGELQQALRVSKNAIRINNFIDADLIKPGAANDEAIIATVGRIMPQKNPQFFNDLAMSMPQCSFLWIGDGQERIKLKAPNIKVTGYITRKEVLSMLSGVSVYIQPSLWEGMPVSILEAMAAATAVVASDIIGNRDIIKNGQNGYLCNVESISDFKAAINKLLSDKALRERIGIAGREFVIENHSLKTAIGEYTKVYLASR